MDPDRGIMGTMSGYIKWIGIALVVVAFTALLFVLFGSRKAAPVTPPPVTLPGAGTTGASTPGGSSALMIRGKLGTVTMVDFLHNGVTAADPQNPGTSYLAGSPGYCLADGTCPHGATTAGFNIAYDSSKQSFTIALLAEPLGAVRAKAEQFLVNALGITESQLCTLNYYVGTTYYVNQQYAGRNLGFSFCPNATVLPE